MSESQEIMLHLDGVEVRLTHPDKIMFPQTGITKEDLVGYYKKMAPYILFHNKGRPLVFVRYPHGLGSYSFFQKNMPSTAPAWMEIWEAGKYKKSRYLILNRLADLVWMLQMGVLEFHVMPVRKPHLENPDLMVFDLDPPEGASFAEIRDFGLAFRPVIQSLGYQVYVKTSGKKGIHLVCPIRQQYSVDQVLEAARDIAMQMIATHPEATLDVRKEKRKGKFLIDIYRNRAFQTFSMVYGTRAWEGAPVSFPLSWEELASLDDPHHFHLGNVPAIVSSKGDAWADIYEHATGLHLPPA